MQDNQRVPDESEQPATRSGPDQTDRLGGQIGPYKLMQAIGEGGMGTVFLAQQEVPVRRRVALKIIKPGMDSKQVVARFDAERQALSLMEHPHIAKVLDAGTTPEGRPYFVMELVKGLPVTQYCDEKKLGLELRLKLFAKICDAVQHAHQKGIIHRDIKPSNVLVAEYDGQAMPKIIDFGLAKALYQPLTDHTLYTQIGQVVGTLEYLSPEQSQMNQLDVDTRTDIYSLGVLLYELLTGTVPFEKKRLRSAALEQVLRIIREEEPPRPSARVSSADSSPQIAASRGTELSRLGLLLRGDLDWIVMKAMEKERDRRYESANGLKMDVQRYLNGEPVVAAPPSARYRLQKFIRRNRVAVGLSLAVMFTLAAAVVGTSAGMIWALIENRRANQHALAAEQQKGKAEVARRQSVYSQYVSNIPAANSFLDNHSTILARQVLINAPVEHRGFEWALLANRAWPRYASVDNRRRLELPDAASARDYWVSGTARVLREIIPSEVAGGLNVGQFSAGGESVFLALASGVVKRFSVDTGEHLASYETPSGVLITAGVSADDKALAGFTFSSRLSIWDVEQQSMLATHPDEMQKSAAWICRWSPDQEYIASSHMGGTMRIWKARGSIPALHREWNAHDRDIYDLQIAASQDYLWTASLDGVIKKSTFPEAEHLSTFSAPTRKPIEYQGISSSGDIAVTVCEDGSSFLWDIESEAMIRSLADPAADPYVGDNRFAASFSGDQSCVVVMNGRLGATVFDVATGTPVASIAGHGYPLRAIYLSPDGRRILTISEDNRARIWGAIPDPPTQLSKAHDDVVFQIDVDAAGTRLLVGSFDSTASIWNLNTGRRVLAYTRHAAPVVAVDFSANGMLAASLDALGNVHVWNTATGDCQLAINPESDEFSGHLRRAGGGLRKNFLNFPAVMSTGLFTPDGSRVVAFHQDAMKVFNVDTGEAEAVLDHAHFSGWPVYSHDSSLVSILGMNRQQAGVWDLKDGGKQVAELVGHREYLVMMDFSPVDYRVATCVMESTVIVWDPLTGERILKLEEQGGAVSSLRFSEDGKLLLVGYTDSTARVFDSDSGQLLTTLVGHSNRLRDLRLSPDGTRLLSWAMDDKAMIWDLARPLANQLLVLTGSSKLLQAHWTPDGRNIITAWSDGHIEIWSGATRDDIRNFQIHATSFEDEFDRWRSRFMNVAYD